MRNILFIAYHFHPDAAVGALRTVKYAKYLPENGWQPHILTVEPRYYPAVDSTPLDFACPITRTGVFPRLDDLYRAAKDRLSPRQAAKGLPETWLPQGGEWVPPQAPWIKRFLNSLSNTPDAQSGWLLPGVRAGIRLARGERFDAIYSSGPPNTTHLIALAVARRTGIPWVIDFRDPWYVPGLKTPFLLDWTQQFSRRKERDAILESALVLTTTPEWKRGLISRYGGALEEKCECILNGYDEEDFPPLSELPTAKRRGPRVFLHGGSLYMGRDPHHLFLGLAELIAEGEIGPNEVELRFVGDHDHAGGTALKSFLSEQGLSDVVVFRDRIPRTEYLEMSLDSDVLLLMQSDGAAAHIPAKAFEYLATGNRILLLTGEGATKNLMSEFDHVFTAPIHDKEKIKDALLRLLRLPRKCPLAQSTRERIRALSKSRLTAAFARLLDRHVGGPA